MPDAGALCIARSVEKIAAALDRPIVLVGMMGAGKSTVGRRLAKRLGLPFVDSDSEIESAAGGSTAADVFLRYGEDDYRDGEKRVVARLVDGMVKVIATGGGAFVDPDTRLMLNEKTITVWLDAPVDVLDERTGRRNTRPTLRGPGRRDKIVALDAERRRAYAEAHIHVHSGNGGHGDVISQILSALEQRLGA